MILMEAILTCTVNQRDTPLTSCADNFPWQAPHSPFQNFDCTEEILHQILPWTEALRLEGVPFYLRTLRIVLHTALMTDIRWLDQSF